MKLSMGSSMLLLLLALTIVPACAGELDHEIPTWTKKGMLKGASATEKECRRSNRLWVTDKDAGYCIRYFKNRAKPVEGLAIFFFGGDYVGSDWDDSGHPIRPIYYGDEGVSLYRTVKGLTKSSKDNLLFIVSRPGQLGSSGDHKEKYKRYESRVIDATLDQIKEQYQLRELVLVGQSGGATLVANLLAKRSDVKCAVMGSGAIALHEYASDSGFASSVWATWEDPVLSIARIIPSQAEYYVLAGEGDKIRPPYYQKMYADRLASKGLNVHYLVLRRRGDAHDVQNEALKVADACAKGRSLEQIKRQLNLSKTQ